MDSYLHIFCVVLGPILDPRNDKLHFFPPESPPPLACSPLWSERVSCSPIVMASTYLTVSHIVKWRKLGNPIKQWT